MLTIESLIKDKPAIIYSGGCEVMQYLTITQVGDGGDGSDDR